MNEKLDKNATIFTNAIIRYLQSLVRLIPKKSNNSKKTIFSLSSASKSREDLGFSDNGCKPLSIQ